MSDYQFEYNGRCGGNLSDKIFDGAKPLRIPNEVTISSWRITHGGGSKLAVEVGGSNGKIYHGEMSPDDFFRCFKSFELEVRLR